MKVKVMYKTAGGKQQAIQVILLEIQGKKLNKMRVFKEDHSRAETKMTPMPVEVIQCIICD
jgi:hypothetical protein